MSNELYVFDEISGLIQKIIVENGLELTAQIKYRNTSDDCEGYNAKTFIVDVEDKDKSLNLFIKTPLNSQWHGNILTEKMFPNEIYFYNTIYPAYQDFLQVNGISDGFRNIAKYYGNLNSSIALDNLKGRGFKLCGTDGVLNEGHVQLTVKILAEFHAISYAFKDQKAELYGDFDKNIHNCIEEIFRMAGFDKLIRVECMKFLNSLDPVEDEDLISASESLSEYLMDSLFTIGNEISEYSTLIHGDFWSNNIMYLYHEQNKEIPTDIMLVDWQLLRRGSPAIELSYFFFGASSELTIENIEYYLKSYHDELSKRIIQLGSNPEELYPYKVFKEEWSKFCRCGFAMAFVIIRGLLLQKGEADELAASYENIEKITRTMTNFLNVGYRMKNEQLYFTRLKAILRYFVKCNLL